jgi:colicin import membrane protein
MGLRHVKNRLLNVVVDKPAEGIAAVGHNFTADARLNREAEIAQHLVVRADRRVREAAELRQARIDHDAIVEQRRLDMAAENAVVSARQAEREAVVRVAAERAMAEAIIRAELLAEDARAARVEAEAAATIKAEANAAREAELQARIQAEIEGRRIQAEEEARYMAAKAESDAKKAAAAQKAADAQKDAASRAAKQALIEKLQAELAESASSSGNTHSPSKASGPPAPPARRSASKAKTTEQVEA